MSVLDRMQSRNIPVFLGITIAVAGCGASQSHPKGNSDPEHGQAASSDQDRLHAKFRRKCDKGTGLTDFCECSWGVLSQMVSVDEMHSDDIPDSKLAEFKKRAMAQCSQRIPEDFFRQKVLQGCSQGDAKRKEFCDCVWDNMRQQYSVADMMHLTMKSPEALKGQTSKIARACISKFPDEEFHASYVQGCETKGSRDAQFCECSWTELHRTLSNEEIVNGHKTHSPKYNAAIQRIKQVCEAHTL
jgi:hypothetical protein